MAYYVELTGGDITPVSVLSGGDATVAVEFSGGDIFPGAGGAILQTKAVSLAPTESTQTAQVTPDAGFDGMSEVDVTVGAIPSNYIGSGVPQRTSADMATFADAVTAPAGYYAANSTKSVAAGSATTPATTITQNPNMGLNSVTGRVTASYSKTQSVTPTVSPGYVANGTAGTITTSGSSTLQLTTQGAQTIHPAATDQTIAAAQFLTGAQTIKAVTTTNLAAANIKAGVTIEVGDADDPDSVASVLGTYAGGGDQTQTKSVSYTPSETAISDTVTPDPGYTMTQVDVAVSAIPANYVGSGVTQRTSSDLTASGATVTAPSGYYASNATKTIANCSSPELSGVEVDQYGDVTASFYIASAGYIAGGDYDVTMQEALDVKGAHTYTPTTTNQTIAADQYLIGAQTILGDADLVAGNIKSGVTIFGITGTYSGSGDSWMEQTISTNGAVTQALDPYTLYHFTGTLTSLTVTLNAPGTGEIAHYHFDFNSGSTAPTLSVPVTVTMPDDFSAPEANNRYEVDILNNYGTVVAWTAS